MKLYADTSVLFSLYVTDANSPKADAWRQVNFPFRSSSPASIALNYETPLALPYSNNV